MCALKLIPARMTGSWRRELSDGLSQRPSPRVSDIRKVTGPLCPPTACAAGFHPKHSGGKVGDRTPGCESFTRGCPPNRYAALIGTSPLVAAWNRRTRHTIASAVPKHGTAGSGEAGSLVESGEKSFSIFSDPDSAHPGFSDCLSF